MPAATGKGSCSIPSGSKGGGPESAVEFPSGPCRVCCVNVVRRSVCKSIKKRSKVPSAGNRGVKLIAGRSVPSVGNEPSAVCCGESEGIPNPVLKARAISANIRSLASTGEASGDVCGVSSLSSFRSGNRGPGDGAGVRRPRRSRMLVQACLMRSDRPVITSAIPAVGVGELGRRDASKSTDGALGAVGVGGVRPEESIGSEDPVSKDAAVAAAATLKRVPSTSMLLDEIAPEGRCSKGSASVGGTSSVAVGSGVGVDTSTECRCVSPSLGRTECEAVDTILGGRDLRSADNLFLTGRSALTGVGERDNDAPWRIIIGASGRSGGTADGVASGLGTSVVWTTPCTTTSVPGGGNCRGGDGEGCPDDD